MNPDPADVVDALARARTGDPAATAALFERYRVLLHRIVALRLDRRLAARVDVSDVVQEAFLEVIRRLAEYLTNDERMPFGLWLRWIARDRLLALHRLHLGTERRSVGREVPPLPGDTSGWLVGAVLGREPSPSQAAGAAERAELLRTALGQLDDEERELILWRHFEQLSNRDIAQLLGVTEAASGKRYVRALERLRGLLLGLGASGPS